MKLTIKAICKQSAISEKLFRAVVKQLGGWESYTRQNLLDVYNHGASGGYSGFIYHVDTVAFFNRNRSAILEQLQNIADSVGTGILETVQSFGCVGTDYSVDEIAKAIYTGKGDAVTTVKNALSWFALEEVARVFGDYAYKNDLTHDNV